MNLHAMSEFRVSFGLKHPPSNLKMDDLSYGDAALSLLFGTEWFDEFRSKFGHLVLVFQELEQELKTTLDYMEQANEKRGILNEFEAKPKEASFEMLIRMFASQLDQSEGSRDFIRTLHTARKYRNRLAHAFTDPESLQYHLSAGGRAKIVHQLSARIDRVIPLIMVVHRIGRAYGSDIGRTDEELARIAALRRKALGIKDWKSHVTGEIPEDGDETICSPD